jgi:hypothetical protein
MLAYFSSQKGIYFGQDVKTACISDMRGTKSQVLPNLACVFDGYPEFREIFDGFPSRIDTQSVLPYAWLPRKNSS